MSEFISIDLPPLICALFASMSCALLGNFLVLRRLSLMGDAISHAVLPGIVIAFLISGTRESTTVFIGAAIAGIITAMLVELVRSFGRLETGASMGVVFSIMFALGVLLIEQAAARNVDLDADCLLHGQLETIFWYPPATLKEFFTYETFKILPTQILTSFFVFIGSLAFVLLFFKELTLSSFDPALSTSLGFNSTLLHQMLMLVIAAAVVASFEAVGSILVIAMIICPAATARFYTDKLKTQIILSQIFVMLAVILGYFTGAFGPQVLGFENSINSGGMMTVVAGFLLFSSAILAPEYGILARRLRQRALSVKVAKEDALADLYRYEEAGKKVSFSFWDIKRRQTLEDLSSLSLVTKDKESYALTEKGRIEAQSIIRSHRLWEAFLVDQAGLQPDHVHSSAEKLEHFTKEELATKLAEEQSHKVKDPHGKPIP